MAGIIPGLGGGGGGDSSPVIIQQPPPPPVIEPDTEALNAAALAERRQRGIGRAANVLTSPGGTTDDAPSARKRLTLGY